jgi:hypothetical protein
MYRLSRDFELNDTKKNLNLDKVRNIFGVGISTVRPAVGVRGPPSAAFVFTAWGLSPPTHLH